MWLSLSNQNQRNHEYLRRKIVDTMTMPIESFTKPTPKAGPVSTPASASTPAPASEKETGRSMAENEDSTLLLNTICTDKIPSFAAVGSPDFEAMAASTFGKDWRQGEDDFDMHSITETIQGQLN